MNKYPVEIIRKDNIILWKERDMTYTVEDEEEGIVISNLTPTEGKYLYNEFLNAKRAGNTIKRTRLA